MRFKGELGRFVGDVGRGVKERKDKEKTTVRGRDAAIFTTGLFLSWNGPLPVNLTGIGITMSEVFSMGQLSRIAGATKDAIQFQIRR